MRFRQLYVNGKKAIRSRHPNLEANGGHNFFRLTKVDTLGKAFNVSTSHVSNWDRLDKVEMHVMIAWADAVLRLQKITDFGGYSKIDIQDPEKTMLFNRPYPMLGSTFGDANKEQCYYFENALEFVDTEGEWYLNESNNILYYKPRRNENMSTAVVVVPRLETLVEVVGESTKNKVQNLVFKGLTFAHTNYLRPSEQGFLNLQAGQFNVAAPGGNNYMLWHPHAGFKMVNAQNVLLEENVFSQMAATALDLGSGTNDNRIEGNVFIDIGGTGISVGKFAQDSLTEVHIPYNPEDKDEISTRDTIKNNVVKRVTQEIKGAIGIAGGYPRHVVIEHNEVAYTNYSGISVGFGWTKEKTAMTNNKINWNEIHHVAQLLADAGPIYTLSNQGVNSEIKNNYIHDIAASKWADYWVCPIYLDEGSSGFDVSDNVFVNAPSGVACNWCGDYTESNNNGRDPNTIQNAGIQEKYRHIKDIDDIPIPDLPVELLSSPFAERLAIPGVIEAENFDSGGKYIAYYDEDDENQGGEYRNTGVDIVAISADNFAVGYTQAGEWLKYSVTIKNSGTYKVFANVSSGLDNSGFKLYLDDKTIVDTVIIDNTGGWDTYNELELETVSLSQGDYTLKLEITGSFINIDKIRFENIQSTKVYPLKNNSENGKKRKWFTLKGEFRDYK
ncbi:MAG: carbohydrate-binding protein [Fibrobacter sp.]|nr:carbohydrate-binding protein [Fibrobacter sp.]